MTSGDKRRTTTSRLDLPVDGPGSPAGWGRRFVALVVDWGIGNAIAETFGREGAIVYIADVNEETGGAAGAKLGETGTRATLLPRNVELEAAWQRAEADGIAPEKVSELERDQLQEFSKKMQDMGASRATTPTAQL